MDNFSYLNSESASVDSSDKLVHVENNSFTAVKASQAVRLRIGDDESISSANLETIHELLYSSVSKYSQLNALASQKSSSDDWNFITYKEMYEQCWTVAKSFLKLGLGRYKAVCLLGFTTPRWFFAYIASILAGGVGCGIYTTNKAEACQYALEKSSANIAVVENESQLKKVLQVWDNLPELKAVVQYQGEVNHVDERVYSWTQLLELAQFISDNKLKEMIETQKVNECCQIVFTSGTTGKPKAALISHDNVTNTAREMVEWTELRHERILSYLPLSHIAAQMSDIWVAIASGSTVYFAQPDALKGSLASTLKVVRPTVFLAVPRVWEKIASKLETSIQQHSRLLQIVYSIFQNIGRKDIEMKSSGLHSTPFGFTIANSLMFKKVLVGLGLDRCHLFVSCAAPLSEEVQDCMWKHHVPLIEIYGLTESTGPHAVCLNSPGFFKYQSVGKTMPNYRTKLADDSSNEVCLWGRNIMMGYLDLPDATEHVIDKEGWFHTGDIGKVDSDGFLNVVGRIKDLIITAGGENIPFMLIEQVIKDEISVINHCVLIGDGHRFLSLLVTLQCETDEDGITSDRLSPQTISDLNRAGCKASTVHELLSGRNAKFIDYMKTGFERVNSKVTSRAHTIRKWSLLPEQFSIAGGEIGPTMKLRRNFIMNKYKKLIEAIYNQSCDSHYIVYDVA